MQHSRTLPLVLVAVLAAVVVVGAVASPASADSKTKNFIAGLVVGGIVAAVFDDDDKCSDRYYGYRQPAPHYRAPAPYCSPPPTYCPPTPYYRPSPGRAYNQGYRHGYSDGRTDQWQADRYQYGPSCSTYRPYW